MGTKSELKNQFVIIIGFVALLWGIEVVNIFTQHRLNNFGIVPRNIIGLRGILFSPFLHGGIIHLIMNSVPLLVLGGLVMTRGKKDFFEATIFIILLGGLGTWIIGRPAYHIGASGLVFGYLGFLLSVGYYERTLSSIITAVIVFFLYGGMIWGVLPTLPFVSWEGHLCGLMAGGVAARLYKPQK